MVQMKQSVDSVHDLRGTDFKINSKLSFLQNAISDLFVLLNLTMANNDDFLMGESHCSKGAKYLNEVINKYHSPYAFKVVCFN